VVKEPRAGSGRNRIAMTATVLHTRRAPSARTKELDRLRDEFLSIAEHELRTPLTPLQLQVQMLAQRAPELARDEAAAAWISTRVATLQRQSERLTRLVNELLEASQLSQHPPALELAEVSLGQVVGAVLARLEQGGQLAGSRCSVTASIDPAATGRWDAHRVERIVSNLVENALKFDRGGSVEITVTRDRRTATLAVTDHGIGIAAADQRMIFERFGRAVSCRNYGGFGLGLFIVQQAVESLGGDVRVKSRPGQGATFLVRLPLAGPAKAV
jgi:signal transduction histidine kinase